MLNDYKWIRAFTTYDEWQNSKFSQRNPLTFYTADFTTCQDCHMKREPIKSAGTWREDMARSRRIAGWPAIPPYRSTMASTSRLKKTIEFLKERQLSECRYLRAESE